jgi:autotransporter-associated beta strand protein
VNSLRISTTGASQSLGLFASGILRLRTGGLLFAGSNDFSITGGTLASATATNSDLIVQQYGTGALTISSIISNGTGTSTLTKAGPGKLVLSGVNTYTGANFLNGGSLEVSADNALGSGGALNFYGGTLSIAGASAFSSARNVALGGPGGYVNVSSTTGGTLSGIISGAAGTGPLVKEGVGTLVLGGLLRRRHVVAHCGHDFLAHDGAQWPCNDQHGRRHGAYRSGLRGWLPHQDGQQHADAHLGEYVPRDDVDFGRDDRLGQCECDGGQHV